MKKLVISLIISLSFISFLYSTPIRLIGLGSLNLIVEDESNKLDLFSYGMNVAGLFENEKGSTIKTFIAFGNEKNSGTNQPDMTYWGINIPSYSAAMLNPPMTITNISGIPISANFTYRMEGGYAFDVMGGFSSTTATEKTTNTENYSTMPIAAFIIARDYGQYSAGAGGGYTKIKFTNNENNDEVYATLKVFNGGFGIHLSPLFLLGINGSFGIPDADAKTTIINQVYENSFNGNAYSIGLSGIAKIPGLLKLGTNLNLLNGSLDGKAEMGNVSIDIGKASTTNFLLSSRLIFSSPLFPVKIGTNLDYGNVHPKFESPDTTLSGIDNTTQSTNFGFGVSYALPFFTPGIQYDLSNSSTTDNSVTNGNTTKSRMWDLRFGGEFNLLLASLRGGYIIRKSDPDKNVDNDESHRRDIVAGVSVQPPMQPFKVEFAYKNSETKPVDTSVDQKTTDNTLYFALKMKF